MKKLTTNSKLIGCLMGLSIVALGTGCTDSDYDLSSVDSTIGVGGEGRVFKNRIKIWYKKWCYIGVSKLLIFNTLVYKIVLCKFAQLAGF